MKIELRILGKGNLIRHLEDLKSHDYLHFRKW